MGHLGSSFGHRDRAAWRSRRSHGDPCRMPEICSLDVAGDSAGTLLDGLWEGGELGLRLGTG